MRGVRRMTLLSGLVAAAALLGPGTGRTFGQYAYRGAGYFGGGSALGGGYYFERFNMVSFGSPFLGYGYSSMGYPYPSMGYSYGGGMGYPAYGYYGYNDYGLALGGYSYLGLNSNVETFPLYSLGSYPIFSYVDSSQNSPRPRTISLSTPSTSRNPEGASRAPSEERSGPVLALKLGIPVAETVAGDAPGGLPRTVIYRANRASVEVISPAPAGPLTVLRPTASR